MIATTLVSGLFLVALAAAPVAASDASLSYDSSGHRWNDVCCLAVGNNDVLWAVGDSGQVLKMVNGDSSVGYVIGRGQFDLCGVSFADENHGWIVGHKRDDPERMRGVVFRTATGGDGPQAWIATFPVVGPGVKVPFLSARLWMRCESG